MGIWGYNSGIKIKNSFKCIIFVTYCHNLSSITLSYCLGGRWLCLTPGILGFGVFQSYDYNAFQSYDYNAPIQEHGDFTDKVRATREILQEFNLVEDLPEIPTDPEKTAYGSFDITGQD